MYGSPRLTVRLSLPGGEHETIYLENPLHRKEPFSPREVFATGHPRPVSGRADRVLQFFAVAAAVAFAMLLSPLARRRRRERSTRRGKDLHCLPAQPGLTLALQVLAPAFVETTLRDPGFGRPHARLGSVQRWMVVRLLNALDIQYVPRRLEQAMREANGVVALADVLAELGFSYDTVLTSDAERAWLQRGFAALAAADRWAEAGLSQAPLTDYIRVRDEALDGVVHCFVRASRIRLALRAEPVPFPAFVEGVAKPAETLLTEWNLLPNTLLQDLEEAVAEWQTLHRQFARLSKAVDALSQWLSQDVGASESLARSAAVIGAAAARTREAAMTARTSPVQAIDDLQELLDDLFVLRGAVHTHEPAAGGELAESMRTLRLKYPRDLEIPLVRIAYWSLARETHPCNGGNLNAFCQLTNAYRSLSRHLRTFPSRRAAGVPAA